jgi:hypothetical protein
MLQVGKCKQGAKGFCPIRAGEDQIRARERLQKKKKAAFRVR